MAKTLETASEAVTVGGILGVAEMESWVEARTADTDDPNAGPKPPTGAQRRSLRVAISAGVH